MTEMIIKDLAKWIKQNAGTIVDCIEGCLLDNLMVDCKRGTAYIFEEYVNANSSRYHAYWIKYGPHSPKFNFVYDMWERLAATQAE